MRFVDWGFEAYSPISLREIRRLSFSLMVSILSMRISELERRFVIRVSLPLVLLISFVSLTGIYSDNFYVNESGNWRVQCLGQDIIDLVLIVPFLLISALLTFLNRRAGLALWCGTLLYLIYTFVIYSFSVHFTYLFVFYCFILGTCFYAVLFIIYKQTRERIHWKLDSITLKRVISVYFVLIALFFYVLWLKDIGNAVLNHSTPDSLVETDLITNPVHALDISIILPGMLIVGLLLYKENPLGVMLTPIVLTFMILMDITIGILAFMLNGDSRVHSFVPIALFIMAALSFFLLVGYFRKLTIST